MDTAYIVAIVLISIGISWGFVAAWRTTHLTASVEEGKLPVSPEKLVFYSSFRPLKYLRIAKELDDPEVRRSLKITAMPVLCLFAGMAILLIYPFIKN
jgi:hypothetical protein